MKYLIPSVLLLLAGCTSGASINNGERSSILHKGETLPMCSVRVSPEYKGSVVYTSTACNVAINSDGTIVNEVKDIDYVD